MTFTEFQKYAEKNGFGFEVKRVSQKVGFPYGYVSVAEFIRKEGAKNYRHWQKQQEPSKFTLTITNKDVKESFDYSAGVACTYKTNNGNNLLICGGLPEISDILNCLQLEASAGEYNIDDFQSEFGYIKVSECLKAYLAVQESQKKLKNAFRGFYQEFMECTED